jgi:ribosomal protein S18 acetylase RimI-like enzyme
VDGLTFELAGPEHAKAVDEMRAASAQDLTDKLGQGHWSRSTKIASVRERIKCADPTNLRGTTLYIACRGNDVVGSVMVSTYPPGFWRKAYWQDGKASGLGVFYLVVPPEFQRQGIGKFLMESVEQLAKAHGIEWVRLDAYADNPISTGFYRTIGYEERAAIDLRGIGLVLFEKHA